MAANTRWLPFTFRTLHPCVSPIAHRSLATSLYLQNSSTLENPPKGNQPQKPSRKPPIPPAQETENLKTNAASGTFLGTTKRLPEFSLTDKVVLVSGAARGLALTQAEALLEAGATVYALDRLPEPSPDFYRVQKRAAEELGTTFYYRQIDVRDNEGLNKIVADIGDTQGRMDGLIAAAGIQQETPALDYTAEDANMMFEINITGVFMTAQAVAKQMIRFGNGGSIAMIASMSAHIANRVRITCSIEDCAVTDIAPGSHLPRIQCFKSRSRPASQEPSLGMGPLRHPSQHHIPRLYRHCHGRRTLQAIPRTASRLARSEHARQAQQT